MSGQAGPKKKKARTDTTNGGKYISSSGIAKESNNGRISKAILESPLNQSLFTSENISKLREEHATSGPYTHTVIENLCEESRMRLIHDEMTHNMKANFKETDLFKVFQTGELGALDDSLVDAMPNLLALRTALYSPEFRKIVQDITGCDELTDRIDCSANAYANGCHLLCHDDVIGTRRVSYIIYLTDPDDPWTAEDGGAVELYPLDEASVVSTTPHNPRGEAFNQKSAILHASQLPIPPVPVAVTAGGAHHATQLPVISATISTTMTPRPGSGRKATARHAEQFPDPPAADSIKGSATRHATQLAACPSNAAAAAAVSSAGKGAKSVTRHAEQLATLVQGVPTAVPTRVILPTFNSMLFFTVQPGRSYHSVQEVFSRSKPRISISGWYHGAAPPLGADRSSLQQIMTTGDDKRPFAPMPPSMLIPVQTEQTKQKTKEKKSKDSKQAEAESEVLLPEKDREYLSQWVNKRYLNTQALAEINEQFIQESSLQLTDFLAESLFARLMPALVMADHSQGVGHGRPQLDYIKGTSKRWQLQGPPHKRRYLQYLPPTLDTDLAASGAGAGANDAGNDDAEQAGILLNSVRTELFESAAFGRFLAAVTSLRPVGFRGEVRRFRAGLDYTVAHFGVLTKQSRLDATLCFVNDDKAAADDIVSKRQTQCDQQRQSATCKSDSKKPKLVVAATSSKGGGVDQEDEEEDDDYDAVWEGGDVGAFECFIEADEDPENAEAAEVYRTTSANPSEKVAKDQQQQGQKLKLKAKSTGSAEEEEAEEEAEEEEEDDDDDDDDGGAGDPSTSLLSVSAANNCLSLVLRDEGIMKFVKYVSANAPGSRWDVALEYEIEQDEEEEDGSSSDSGSMGVRMEEA